MFWRFARLEPTSPHRIKGMVLSGLVTVFFLVLVQGLTNGYITKNSSSANKIPAPTFEHTNTEIENRLRAPERLGLESEKRFQEKMDWRQHLHNEDTRKMDTKPEQE